MQLIMLNQLYYLQVLETKDQKLLLKLLDIAIEHYEQGTSYRANKDEITALNKFNRNFCLEYYSITRNEAPQNVIEDFDLFKESGRDSIRLELPNRQITFLENIADNSGKYTISNIMNGILNVLLFKKKNDILL